MIYVLGQATQRNGSSPVWTLSGICSSANRTDTGTYTITVDFTSLPSNIDKNKLVILISAERAFTGSERFTIDWISDTTFRVRNYGGSFSTTLGDCYLTVTILANIDN